MHLMIFYPGGVSYGALPDDASNEEIYDVMYTAATIEQGNGRTVKEHNNEKRTYKHKSKSSRV